MNKYLYFTVIPSIECVDPGSVANASYTSRSWVIASIGSTQRQVDQMEAITHDLPHSKLYSLWVYPMEAMTHNLPHSKLYSLWVDPMEAITHDLPHSKLYNLLHS
jgi:hypothetical protein